MNPLHKYKLKLNVITATELSYGEKWDNHIDSLFYYEKKNGEWGWESPVDYNELQKN